MTSTELRGFVFSVVFIVVFSGLLSTIPAGLQGIGDTPETVIPVDPSLVTGFSDSVNYTRASFSSVGSYYWYEYELDSRYWYCSTDDTIINVIAKILTWGFLWLGQIDPCRFISPDGVDRGTDLTLTTIETDSDAGAVRYDLEFTLSSESAGALVLYWNTTTYDNSTHAWDNDELYMLHGVGIDTTATNNIAEILVGLLFLQLPQVPFLVTLFLAVPTWACVIYILWYVIKEMIPFV